MIPNARGLWVALESENPQRHIGLLEELLKSARAAAVEELRRTPGVTIQQVHELTASYRMTPRHLGDLVRLLEHVAAFHGAYGIRYVPDSEVDDRTRYPIIPLAEGGGINPRNAEELTPEQIQPMMLLDHNWGGGIWPRWDLLDRTPNYSVSTLYVNEAGDAEVDVKGESDAPGADVMAWFIQHHMGEGVLSRLAWSISGIRPVIDTLSIPRSGSGKATLFDCLDRALGGGTVTRQMASRTITPRASEVFTGGVDQATRCLIVALDEADGSKVQIRSGLINELCDRTMTVHPKGRDPYEARRVGNVWFLAGGWPKIDFGVQGVPRRLAWAQHLDVPAISPSTRGRLVMDDNAIGYLAAWLYRESARLWNEDEDAITATSRRAVALFRTAVSDPVRTALLGTVDAQSRDYDWTANDLLRSTIMDNGVDEDELPKGKAWSALVRQVFPQATPKRRSEARGWSGIKLVPDEEPPVRKDRSDS